MLEKFVPDIYQKSIYDINYDTLKKRGIKCLIFDLDNTLVPVTVKKPTNACDCWKVNSEIISRIFKQTI